MVMTTRDPWNFAIFHDPRFKGDADRVLCRTAQHAVDAARELLKQGARNVYYAEWDGERWVRPRPTFVRSLMLDVADRMGHLPS